MAGAQDNRMDELERSLGDIQSEMREQIARTRVNTRIVLIVGLVVVAIIIGYLSWLMGQVKQYADPRGIAEDMMNYATKNAPAVANQLEAKLKEDAPDNVRKIEAIAMTQASDLRAKAIVQAKQYFIDNAPKWEDMAIAKGEEYVKNNSEQIRTQLAAAAKKYLTTIVAQLPDLREKAWTTIHTAVNQIPQMRKDAEAKALAQMDQLTTTVDERADAIVDELLKNAATLKPLVDAASTPEGQKNLTDELTKQMDTIVGTEMDKAFKEFDASLTPYEQTLDELQAEKLEPAQKLHKEMITSMLLLLDDALALGQLGTAPAPAPVVTP